MKRIQKKICLLGDFAVGKTSLIRRFVEERFDEGYQSTIGVHLSRKIVPQTAVSLELFIWDLAGGEDFKGIGPNYLRGSAGAIIVADLTRTSSLTALTYYAEQLRQICPQAALTFVGNKLDLATERTVTHDAFLSAILPYASTYILTSAKNGENVEIAFQALADQIESVP